MANYNHFDLAFYDGDIEGDLIISEDGDFQLTGDFECPRQDIINRVRTQTGDWRSHPEIGGDLELLEGEPNTRETAMRGLEQIHETLTYDDRFLSEDLVIRPVPSDIYRIDYYIFLDTETEKPIVVQQSLNL